MANIKEKDLPVASSIASTDYLRMVDASGASKKILESVLFGAIVPNVQQLTRSSNWTDGYIYFASIGKLGILSAINVRRSSATSGYMTLADIPTGVSQKTLIATMGYMDNGTATRSVPLRISSGAFQVNTSSNIPSYGVYGIYIFEMN